MLFTFVRIDSDTNKFSCGFNKIIGREQTVLRICVARSEHARYAIALSGGGHKHDGPTAAFGFCLSRLPGGVPRDAWLTDIQFGGTQI